jgi:hypothetical protein
VKLTFAVIVVILTLIGMPNHFQNSNKDFLLRYNLKRVDVRKRVLNRGLVSNSPFNELTVSQFAMQATKASVKPFK